MNQEIQALQTKLRNDMQKAKDFQHRQANGQSFDFKETIVPFVNEVQQRTEEWKELVHQFVQVETMQTLNATQVEHTYENMYVIPTESFQKTMREQRFIERIQAVYYVLDLVEEEMQNSK
ncbi:hypothetical protein DH09_06475 [Bacillaceae bacterium JMAK1]|nr:hypothetical protein DH09_06475 [Bacillaceae bacterium JMAK1]